MKIRLPENFDVATCICYLIRDPLAVLPVELDIFCSYQMSVIEMEVSQVTNAIQRMDHFWCISGT